MKIIKVNVLTLKESSDQAYLDRQQITLPSTFQRQNLVKIRLVDNGEKYVQKVFLTGITVWYDSRHRGRSLIDTLTGGGVSIK